MLLVASHERGDPAAASRQVDAIGWAASKFLKHF
jgi:hypothetical protein